jgi:hypothetical protein
MAFHHAWFAMHRVNHQEAYSLQGDIYANNAESFFSHRRKIAFYSAKIVASALKIIA